MLGTQFQADNEGFSPSFRNGRSINIASRQTN